MSITPVNGWIESARIARPEPAKVVEAACRPSIGSPRAIAFCASLALSFPVVLYIYYHGALHDALIFTALSLARGLPRMRRSRSRGYDFRLRLSDDKG